VNRRVFAHAALAVTLASSAALALPKLGEPRPNVVLKDAWDRTYDLANVGARPLLLVYEDKESSSQNQAFKDELAKMAKGQHIDRIVLAAVADVDGYDYWPARGFVKDAIRSQSVAMGTSIFCDWSGSLRARLGLRRSQSTVILYDASGRVVFAHEGTMNAETRARAIALLRAAMGGG
jgi:Bacterial protein of unknown function (YtfJ_HI0045)